MTPSHLENAVSLQQALHELTTARHRLADIPDWMRELHEEHQARRADIEALEAAVEEARRERRATEGEITDFQEKLKRYQQQINAVQNQREYGALLQEIDTAKSGIKAAEERAFAALERREAAERDLEAARQDFAALDERYRSELEKWEAEKPGVEEEIRSLTVQVEGLRSQLPRPFLALFDRLQARYQGEALAQVRRIERAGRGPAVYHCSACNYRVRPQVVVEIKNSQSLIQCDSCKRVLYVMEESREAALLA
jgi:predicted  nucleic acid-binding Zn-ribbon protein